MYKEYIPEWLSNDAAAIKLDAIKAAKAHQKNLTKPAGSLGDLESIAIQFSGYQGKLKPEINTIAVRVFAADHGVCAQNISAFPQIVTTQMIENFVRGGAAISVLSKQILADLCVVNLGTANPLISTEGVYDCAISSGTQDFSKGPAMSFEQCAKALEVGRKFVTKSDLFIGGEMGIGNTTVASALYSALLFLPPQVTTGPGTGIDEGAIKNKAAIIEKALNINDVKNKTPFEILSAVGGYEIAALTGAYISAAQQGIPALVDGFISTSAALVACKLNPSVRDWLIFSHQSAEPAHKYALETLMAKPLLDMGMRLGEGSGAALAVPLIQSALALHNQMATFEQAGVSSS